MVLTGRADRLSTGHWSSTIRTLVVSPVTRAEGVRAPRRILGDGAYGCGVVMLTTFELDEFVNELRVENRVHAGIAAYESGSVALGGAA